MGCDVHLSWMGFERTVGLAQMLGAKSFNMVQFDVRSVFFKIESSFVYQPLVPNAAVFTLGTTGEGTSPALARRPMATLSEEQVAEIKEAPKPRANSTYPPRNELRLVVYLLFTLR